MTYAAIGTVTSKGQVTLPKAVRDRLGVKEGDRVIFEVDGERAVVRRLSNESLAALFGRQKPWTIRAVPFQRNLRNEWAGRRH
jgi:AbrB family looped-hinge helix DNA binding protein